MRQQKKSTHTQNKFYKKFNKKFIYVYNDNDTYILTVDVLLLRF